MNKVLFTVLFVVSISLLLGSQEAFAEMKTWDMGAGTENWTDDANWNPDGVPTSSDDIVIPDGFDVIMNTDFTVNSGSITIETDGLLRVPKDRTLENLSGTVTNKGFFFVDGKVVNTIGDTIENKAGALWGVQGDGSANNGVVINEGTVNSEGEIEGEKSKWTNSHSFNIKKAGKMSLMEGSFTNKIGGKLNLIGEGSSTTAFITKNTKVTNESGGDITISLGAFQFESSIPTVLLKNSGKIDLNDGSLLGICSALVGLDNFSIINVNPGGELQIGLAMCKAEISNDIGGEINVNGTPSKPGKFFINDLVGNQGTINNNKDGFIFVQFKGLLQNNGGRVNLNEGSTLNIDSEKNKAGFRTIGPGKVVNKSADSVLNFGLIEIAGPWENFGKIENEGIINVLCDGSIEPFGTIIGDGELNQFDCPVDSKVVGGIPIYVEQSSLILAGAQSFSWMLPVVLSGIGIGLFLFRKSE